MDRVDTRLTFVREVKLTKQEAEDLGRSNVRSLEEVRAPREVIENARETTRELIQNAAD